VPCERGLAGHSDADVLTHAIMDALLGAAGLDDIGSLFPDSDARYADASSVSLLAEVVARIGGEGWRVVNVDAVVLCEQPRLAEHRAAMRAVLASVLGVAQTAVGIKATTTEQMGFTGRGEGIAATAVCLLEAVV
jgi:2-C-methyl-D-erythritol 2,4-cyclodiphosphate synthase